MGHREPRGLHVSTAPVTGETHWGAAIASVIAHRVATRIVRGLLALVGGVVIGLSITGYTYGAMLGAFLLGLLIKRADEVAAALALVVTVAGMAYVVLRVKITPAGEVLWWEAGSAKGSAIAFPWYVPMGVLITLIAGGLVSLIRPRPVRAPRAEQFDQVGT